jgi:hypothetical protein
MTIDTIAAMMADELRRLPCRVNHEKEPCARCDSLALHDIYKAAQASLAEAAGDRE